MMITVRRYRPDDAPVLWTVFYSAIRETAAKDYSPEQIAAWAPESFDDALWAQRMTGIAPFVAERDGVVVGYADVQANGYVDHFFVAGHAGRQGVGSHLMQQIHAHADSMGVTSLFSDVSITARPFFEHWGFAVEQQQSLVVAGVRLTNYRMRKAQLTHNGADALDPLARVRGRGSL
jgi:putative acetyltransferase